MSDYKRLTKLGNLLYSLQEERNPFCLAELILKEGWGSAFCTKAHEKLIKEAKQKDEIIKRLIKKKNKLQAQIYKLKKENE